MYTMTNLRNVCFTINNYSDEDIISMDIYLNRNCKYWVYGFEVGDNETPHIQGYLELKRQTKFATVKRALPKAHLESRRGTAQQAADYCKKEGNFEEGGEISQQGLRGDLDRVRQEALDNGMRKVTEFGNLQQIKVAEKYLTYNEEGRDWKPEVFWIFGPSGCGKSRQARELCIDDCYVKSSANKWWDGYDNHENVIIDDFRDAWWDLTYLLNLIDRYEFRIETKGGMRQFRARRIVITAPKHPQEYYRNAGEDIRQLLRRIDNIVNLVPEVVPEVEEVILEPLDI